jgi:PadR family transcriptional regulator, regulatory protein PadR
MSDHEILSGLIRLHVLYHASREGLFGLGMMHELRHHGYKIGPGTLYPLLHRMEEKGYLRSVERTVDGKQRRWYTATPRGRRALAEAKARVKELFNEIVHDQTPASRGGEGASRLRIGRRPRAAPTSR